MINAIFWDFGGVIVNDNMHPAFEDVGVPYDAQIKAAWRDHRLGKIDQKTFYERAFAETAYAHLRPRVEQHAEELLELHPNGALPIIKQLQGRYTQGVISNHAREWGRIIVQKFNLEALLDPIVISAEVGMDKTDPEIFRYALEKANVAAEKSLFVDNTEYCLETAAQVGMRGILFRGRESLVRELRAYGIETRQSP
ncbi:HAD-IA family hydrolase [Candidatus Woesearchaeota archaeon]|nr:HAD-IA family hydrolase [Candidatus Woesearchaeota archaeon]